MNSDIYDELELTDDITFDHELKLQERNRAARVIQRWFKDRQMEKLEKRTHEAMLQLQKSRGVAMREQEELTRLKKERLIKQYVLEDNLRDSVEIFNKNRDVSDWERCYVDKNSNFSLYNQDQPLL